jgi:RNA polymerase sigma factor (sigma-70 family)
VRNQALNAIRHQAADTRRRDAIGAVAHDGDTVAGIPLADPSPEQLALWNELMDAFERTLDALTERQRTAVLLRYEQGCTVPEVAVVLGIAPKAAEKLLSRALRELRSRLEDFAR